MSTEVHSDGVSGADHVAFRSAQKEWYGARAVVLAIVLSVAGVVEAVRVTSLTSLSASDVWWHLRSGLWILQNHALPHFGIYSQSAQLPWAESSWLYDVMVAVAYKLAGIAALPAALMLFRAALAVITFVLAGGTRGRFWVASVLSLAVQYILVGVAPTPTFCSVLFFGLELILLFETRRGAGPSLLLWAIPLFLVWANVSPQFVFGMGAFLLFVIWEAFKRHALAAQRGLPVFGLSLVASLATPYTYKPWASCLHSITSDANQYFPDRLAMRFHQPQDYLLLLLTMAAFLSLGIRRSRDPFLISTLVASAALSFYSQSLVWLVAIVSVSVIADSMEPENNTRNLVSARALRTSAAASFLVLVAAFVFLVPHKEGTLISKTSTIYPVAAADYIRNHKLAQPLFNAYEWGGFLMWYMPDYPVAIDGRTDLYPDDVYVTYSKILNADLPMSAYPSLAQARTILLPRKSLLARALSAVPSFKVVYQDEVSTVLAPVNLDN
jgi:hypothetical protein